jgi:nucleoside-diphosphate-sugar epimerase
MRILLTGASSFTGYWFARTLAEAGHEVTAPLRRAASDYGAGVRGGRVKRLQGVARVVESCIFGAERFQALLRTGRFDVLCHHAAMVENYRSLDFDVAKALEENTRNLAAVLRLGMENGLSAVVLTGSVFEASEGAGSLPLVAFSPYALAKGATSDAFRFWCARLGLKLAKFVIPNPFGPYEEPRFCDYLLQCWSQRRPAVVKTPDYVRDNIHASLLAGAYGALVGALNALAAYSHHAPSGYVESQGAFARRIAREIGARLDLACALELPAQTEFAEPMVRINTEPCDHARLGWHEAASWDALADYYRAVHMRRVAGAAA